MNFNDRTECEKRQRKMEWGTGAPFNMVLWRHIIKERLLKYHEQAIQISGAAAI